MLPKERLTLTGLPYESLNARFYPDNPESPTFGHLQALTAVANGRPIDEDVKEAVIKSAIRYGDHLERAIDGWNKQVLLIQDPVKINALRQLSFKVMEDAMTLSYGLLAGDPKERRKLINGAFGLLNTNTSFN